ncbi:MAG: ribosome maturation factor RimM [Acidimicrobiia bacterium]
MTDGERVVVGRIGRSHGLDGTMVVHPDTDNPDRFLPGHQMQTESGLSLTVRKARPLESVILASFVEITDRDEADSLRGAVLTITADERRALDVDEFWPEDLVGLEVRDPSGTRIGSIVALDTDAPQHRLTIATNRGEVMVPLVGELVPEIDLAGGFVVVVPIEGLF